MNLMNSIFTLELIYVAGITKVDYTCHESDLAFQDRVFNDHCYHRPSMFRYSKEALY